MLRKKNSKSSLYVNLVSRKPLGCSSYFEQAKQKLQDYEEDTRRLLIRSDYGLECPHHSAQIHANKKLLPSFLYFQHNHNGSSKSPFAH